MDTLLQIGLSNALVATLLAVLAASVSRFCRRPALVHTLWLLVLLKLITPAPLVLPVSVPLVQIASSESDSATDQARAGAMSDSQRPWFATLKSLAGAAARWLKESWGKLFFCCWLCGSVLWFVMAGIRSYRFSQLLHYGRPAPRPLQEQLESLAKGLGLGHCPALRLLPGVLSPMLWGVGNRTWLLLPADLLKRLDAEQLRTLLAHELAHARRRDPYVRVLELIVLCLYWWLPVAWWARRRLREAEEQCCDAWVIWTLPASAPSYATALVETVAFLSAARRPALPPIASGIGYVRILEKRLSLILIGSPPKQLSALGLIAVAGLGLALLPCRPVLGRADEPAAPAGVARALEPTPVPEPMFPEHATVERVAAKPSLAEERLVVTLPEVKATPAAVPVRPPYMASGPKKDGKKDGRKDGRKGPPPPRPDGKGGPGGPPRDRPGEPDGFFGGPKGPPKKGPGGPGRPKGKGFPPPSLVFGEDLLPTVFGVPPDRTYRF